MQRAHTGHRSCEDGSLAFGSKVVQQCPPMVPLWYDNCFQRSDGLLNYGPQTFCAVFPYKSHITIKQYSCNYCKTEIEIFMVNCTKMLLSNVTTHQMFVSLLVHTDTFLNFIWWKDDTIRQLIA